MGGNRFLLLGAWLLVLTITLVLWMYIPTLTGGHTDVHPLHFLPYPPGVAIAVLAGSTGGMLNGLFKVWNEVSHGGPVSSQHDPAFYYLPPILGAFAGILMFLIIAAGGLSIIDPKGAFSADLQQSASVASLLYKLTPTSPPQLAVFVIYTAAAGYYFTRVPETFGLLEGRARRRTNRSDRRT